MKLDRKQLAALFNITTRTVSEWSTDPEFPKPKKKGRSNYYDAPAVVRWWRDREIARLVEGEDGRLLDLDQERARLARAQRERVELDMRTRRGELIERDPVRRAFRVTARRIRDGLLAIADRTSPIAAAENDQDRVHALMVDEIEQTLTILADGAWQFAHEAEAEAARSD